LRLLIGLEPLGAAQRERSQDLGRRRVMADQPPPLRDRFGDLVIDRNLDASMTAGHGYKCTR
jgi:hypothetical protein